MSGGVNNYGHFEVLHVVHLSMLGPSALGLGTAWSRCRWSVQAVIPPRRTPHTLALALTLPDARTEDPFLDLRTCGILGLAGRLDMVSPIYVEAKGFDLLSSRGTVATKGSRPPP